MLSWGDNMTGLDHRARGRRSDRDPVLPEGQLNCETKAKKAADCRDL